MAIETGSDAHGNVEINGVNFVVDVSASSFIDSLGPKAEDVNWASISGNASNYFVGAISDFQVSAEFAGNLTAVAGATLTEENKEETIRKAVGWFKSEDLGLLYKVLDDPQAFGIHKISGGQFSVDVRENFTRTRQACIVGALAIAKAPEGATGDQIEELAADITDNGIGGSIALGVLDQIINRGHLDEFKAEIQRQMLER